MTILIAFPGGKVGSFTIPDGVMGIGVGAFCHCTSLTSITIPDGVTDIENLAFHSRASLTSITFEGDSPTVAGDCFDQTAPSLTIYHYLGSSGFTTPEWEGVPTTVLRAQSAPRDLLATFSHDRITIYWSVPSTDAGSSISGYRVYRGTSSGALNPLVTIGDVIKYEDEDVTMGSTYYYAVSAMNAYGEGSPSMEALSTTPSVNPMSAPQDLKASKFDGGVVLTWSAPSDDGGLLVTGYTIYRGTMSDALTHMATVGNVLSYVDTSVDDDSTYYYAISATNVPGESTMSGEVSTESDGASTDYMPLAFATAIIIVVMLMMVLLVRRRARAAPVAPGSSPHEGPQAVDDDPPSFRPTCDARSEENGPMAIAGSKQMGERELGRGHIDMRTVLDNDHPCPDTIGLRGGSGHTKGLSPSGSDLWSQPRSAEMPKISTNVNITMATSHRQ